MTTSAESSLWLDGAAPAARPSLPGDAEADVVVVGGGIAGLTTALRVQQQGARVIVLEAGRIATGVTGNNTAKVTALAGTMLSTITQRHDAETAAVYAAAARAAVEDVAELSPEHCERRPAVTFAAEQSELASVAGEHEAAQAAGVPVEWRDDDAGLPYAVAGATWLHDQLFVHPVRHVRGLADAFEQAGGTLHEDTRVLSVSAGSPTEVRTETATVRAEQVVIATHYPILDRGLYFARLDAQRSYCISAPLRGAPPSAMAINSGSTTRSLQWCGDQLVVGGEGHSAGSKDATLERFEALEAFASAHWDIGPTTGRWSAQDPIPYDHLPMIGPLVPRSKRLWVATGFAKWGLSGGTFAARILADAIAGRDHEWASTFTPSRFNLSSTPEIAKLGGKFSALIAGDRVTPAEVSSAEDVPAGEARVVRDGLGKSGFYRDDSGELHGVSLRCTHMGCLLRFNGAERSWDCPCHGSRFDVDGSVLEGPAVHALERRDP